MTIPRKIKSPGLRNFFIGYPFFVATWNMSAIADYPCRKGFLAMWCSVSCYVAKGFSSSNPLAHALFCLAGSCAPWKLPRLEFSAYDCLGGEYDASES